jgi:hypothetical protein
MRRAGFGAHPDDLDKLLEMRYEDVVEDLLHPERFPGIDEDLLMRYNPSYDIWEEEMGFWVFRMVNTGRPLVEKMASHGAVTRQDVRAETAKPKAAGKPRSFIFAFKPPTKTFQLRMSFKKGRVDKSEIIEALENIIKELRSSR